MFSKSSQLLRQLTIFTMRRGLATNTNKIGIIGVPFGKGQRRNGVHLGPKAIRDAGLVQEIINFNQNVDIKDYGDVPEVDVDVTSLPKNMQNYHTVIGTMRNLSHRVNQVLNEDRMCVTLGGDHSLGIGKYFAVFFFSSKMLKNFEF